MCVNTTSSYYIYKDPQHQLKYMFQILYDLRKELTYFYRILKFIIVGRLLTTIRMCLLSSFPRPPNLFQFSPPSISKENITATNSGDTIHMREGL
jgi:hypothetical protein